MILLQPPLHRLSTLGLRQSRDRHPVSRRRPQPIGSSALRRPVDVALPAGSPVDLSRAKGTAATCTRRQDIPA